MGDVIQFRRRGEPNDQIAVLTRLLGMAMRNEIRGVAIATLMKDPDDGHLECLSVVSSEGAAHSLEMTGAITTLKDDWMRLSEPEHYVPPDIA